MVLPAQPQDFFDAAGILLGNQPQPADGFRAATVPSTSGLGTRTGSLRNEIAGQSTRKLVHWLVPEGPIIQMYCNPQSIRTNYSKDIQSQRTKGGFVIQYWGEALTVLDISGTTGTSGIEGINVLNDIYRSEQVAFDPFGLFLAAKNRQDNLAGDIFGIGSALTGGADGFVDGLIGAAEEATPQARPQSPSLASLATQVEMYWSGQVYRGFFNSFSVTERADNIGLFDYEMKFTVTQIRGFRRNFLAWHRSPAFGPSHSGIGGPPRTFGNLLEGVPAPPRRIEQPSLDPFKSLGSTIESIF